MRTIFVGVILMSSVAVGAGDKVQPLNIRVGLWEVSTTVTRSGQMPIPAEFLARLTPEQRARMEERMKASSAEKTTTRKECMTKEKLAKESAFGEDNQKCTRTVLSSTGSKTEVKMQCGDEGLKGDGTFVVEALNSESVKGSVQMVATGSDHTMNSSSTFTAKWMGPACGDVK